MREARIRLRSVRLKDGGAEIRVLRSPTKADDRAFAEHIVGKCMDHDFGSRIAGFAFVVWGPDNASVAYSYAGEASRIPRVMVPDFARERLMLEIAERFARE